MAADHHDDDGEAERLDPPLHQVADGGGLDRLFPPSVEGEVEGYGVQKEPPRDAGHEPYGGEDRHRDEGREHLRGDEELRHAQPHPLQGVDLLVDLHRGELRGDRRAGAGGDHDPGHDRGEFPGEPHHHEARDVDLNPEGGCLGGREHRDDEAEKEVEEGDDADGADADILDLGDEPLPPQSPSLERRDERPVDGVHGETPRVQELLPGAERLVPQRFKETGRGGRARPVLGEAFREELDDLGGLPAFPAEPDLRAAAPRGPHGADEPGASPAVQTLQFREIERDAGRPPAGGAHDLLEQPAPLPVGERAGDEDDGFRRLGGARCLLHGLNQTAFPGEDGRGRGPSGGAFAGTRPPTP